jgi:hypothetical protein
LNDRKLGIRGWKQQEDPKYAATGNRTRAMIFDRELFREKGARREGQEEETFLRE